MTKKQQSVWSYTVPGNGTRPKVRKSRGSGGFSACVRRPPSYKNARGAASPSQVEFFSKKKSYIHLKVTLWHQLDGLPSNKHPIMGLRPNTQGNLVSYKILYKLQFDSSAISPKKILPSTKYHIQSRSAFAKPPLWQTQPQYIKDK